jgi:argininosuccinate lyase
MLARQGILSEDECDAIVAGLTRIRERIAAGTFEWSVELEDVHMNIEAALTADIGDAGKRCTPGARATTRSPPISASGCATRSTPSRRLRRLQTALLDLAEREATPSCPASRTCRSPSRSPSATT